MINIATTVRFLLNARISRHFNDSFLKGIIHLKDIFNRTIEILSRMSSENKTSQDFRNFPPLIKCVIKTQSDQQFSSNMASEQEIPLLYLNKGIRFLYEFFDVMAPLWYYDCRWLGDLNVQITVKSYNIFFFLFFCHLRSNLGGVRCEEVSYRLHFIEIK